MLDSARRTVRHVAGMQREEFEADEKTRDAVTYRIGVVGEAARGVSNETRTLLPIDWIGITSMRNRLYHGYRELSLDIVWTTAVEELPELIIALEKYLA
jgi:uncharacterized protein with HEPN domain